ncbi:phosphatase PAP2 family protein [Natronosporangium hydrolyticum]|uniref:Phosphatase PAP2 family protein n=1 Tax=Natronosporangium hydrolyticum TaxID=2811111 RepID=A0A895YGQ3_9ACTN|nr:glycerophosphodiester phosphodiesterase family protein [Natronosporangium hydrolyticum]QSB16741.1 phosphatase PAP2 family protein [Natronosporangium hydrolyticum]
MGAGLRRARLWLLLPIVVTVAVIAAVWAQADPVEPVPHFAERDVSIIAHAGAQGHAPPNTMEAFQAAVELGADVLEMDLQITADGEIVTIHDGTVDRTTDGSGPVSELTLAELRALDAGYTWRDEQGGTPFRGHGVRHATLREVFEAFPDTPLVIELKTDGGEAIIQPTIDLIVEYDRGDSVAVASFREEYLQPVRAQLPGVATNMPESETYDFYVRQLFGLHPWWTPPGQLFQVPEHFDGRRVVTPRFVRAAERLGVEVHVWTVNDPEQMHRVLDAGAHGIITDYPDRAVEVLAEREAARGDVRGINPDQYDDQLTRIEYLQQQYGWLTPVMSTVTFFGDEEAYLLLLPIIYWVVNRRIGIRLGVMLLLTAGVNSLLKLGFATPRPAYLDPGLELAREHSFGLPSGHAQNAAAIWGVLAASLRGWPVRIGLVALIVAIGWSRIHLGAHFLEDIFTGWLVGLLLVVLYLWLAPRGARWVRRLSTGEQIAGAVAASLLLIAPAVLLSSRLINVSFPWPGVIDAAELAGASGVVTAAATLAGFGIGLALLHARGGFDHRGPIGRRLLRLVVGLVGVVAIWQGLGVLFPGGEEPLALVLRYVRYALVGLWVGGVAPLLFRRLGLADRLPPEPPTTEPGDGSAHPAPVPARAG